MFLILKWFEEVVTEGEFQEFLELADYMNFNFNPI